MPGVGDYTPPVRLLCYSDAHRAAGAEGVLVAIVAGVGTSFSVTVMGPESQVVNEVASADPEARAIPTRRVRGRRELGGLLALRRQIKHERPDVMHINLTDMAASLPATLAALSLRRVAVVVVEHHPWPPQSRLQQLAKMITVRLADAHVAVSDSLAEAVGAVTRRDARLTRVIHNGVPAGAGVARPSLTSRPFELGMACRLDIDKGVDVVLRALAKIAVPDAAVPDAAVPDAAVPDAAVPDAAPAGAAVVNLTIAGDGPERVNLELLARRLGIENHVRFLGWVEDPSAVYDDIDLFVLGSRSEALPLSVLEAMHAGRAVVATNVGGVAEAVVHGVTGMVVPPEDPNALANAISQLAADEAKLLAMGIAGQARARQEFDVEVMVRRYRDLYIDLSKGVRPRSKRVRPRSKR